MATSSSLLLTATDTTELHTVQTPTACKTTKLTAERAVVWPLLVSLGVLSGSTSSERSSPTSTKTSNRRQETPHLAWSTATTTRVPVNMDLSWRIRLTTYQQNLPCSCD